MTVSLRRLRAPFVALVALALSAGLAFAGQPAGASGHSRASSYANTTLPVRAATDVEDPDESTDTETDADASDAVGADSADSADNCTTDPTGLTEEELAAMTHGSVVCWAAHQPTPPEYANHGAWVSHWAHTGKGGQNASNHASTGASKH